MKLQNKKTGQVGNFIINKDHFECVDLEYVPEYRNLAELNEDWEDYEEPKEFWYIDADGKFLCEPSDDRCEFDCNCREIGNYFETKEEAEKAVEKLKAWQRLKEVGFRIYSWNGNLGGENHYDCCGQVNIAAVVDNENKRDVVKEDLDLLFDEQEHIRKKAQKVVEDNADYYDKFGSEK